MKLHSRYRAGISLRPLKSIMVGEKPNANESAAVPAIALVQKGMICSFDLRWLLEKYMPTASSTLAVMKAAAGHS